MAKDTSNTSEAQDETIPVGPDPVMVGDEKPKRDYAAEKLQPRQPKHLKPNQSANACAKPMTASPM